jgi:hypothetical protein
MTGGGNFGFQKKESPQLAKLGRLAERYFFDDPPAALVKLRQFAEITARDEPASILLERIRAQRAAAPQAKRGRRVKE